MSTKPATRKPTTKPRTRRTKPATATLAPLPPLGESGLGWLAYAAEELKRDPSLAIAPEPAAVVKARDEGGLRWERVAAYAGIKESAARKLYEEGSGKSARLSHTGRGRNFAAEYEAAQAKPAKKRRARKAPAKGKVTPTPEQSAA